MWSTVKQPGLEKMKIWCVYKICVCTNHVCSYFMHASIVLSNKYAVSVCFKVLMNSHNLHLTLKIFGLSLCTYTLCHMIFLLISTQLLHIKLLCWYRTTFIHILTRTYQEQEHLQNIPHFSHQVKHVHFLLVLY